MRSKKDQFDHAHCLGKNILEKMLSDDDVDGKSRPANHNGLVWAVETSQRTT